MVRISSSSSTILDKLKCVTNLHALHETKALLPTHSLRRRLLPYHRETPATATQTQPASAWKGVWGERRGSNPRPPESQSGALPTELRSPLLLSMLKCAPTCFVYYRAKMVRPRGLEPLTPGLAYQLLLSQPHEEFVVWTISSPSQVPHV